MSSFNASTDLPSNVNTLERLAAWVGLCLARTNPTLKILEAAGVDSVRACEVVTIKDDAGVYRLVVRLSLPLDSSYAEATTKFWESTTELSNTAIPTAFKSN